MSWDIPDLDTVSIADVLKRRAEADDRMAFAFVRDDLEVLDSLTYSGLLQGARVIAKGLDEHARPGSRILLVYPPGLEFVRALYGCLIAGMVPVPVSSPEPARAKHASPRLRAIATSAGARLVLTDSNSRALLEASAGLQQHRILATDVLTGEGVATPISTGADDCAYLQYTSGSTAAPRGVIISHANLLANCRALSLSLKPPPEGRVLSWLPHFHDYGLVHGVFWPVFAGIPSFLMAPLTFVRRPLRWLEAIERFSITHSGAPNFAYAACTQALARNSGWRGDLRSWRVASCGAEPINPKVVRQFIVAFQPHGFDATAFSPAYGLAEATLVAAVKPHGTEPKMLHVDASALAAGRISIVPPGTAGGRELVSSGSAVDGMDLRIVDPATGEELESGRVGEIWLAGSSVGEGYYGLERESQEIFDGRLPDTSGRFLRTGDLGFVLDGEVFVTGRLKDLLILHGRNIYPQDIEWTAERAHSHARPGYSAAFSVDTEEGEQIVLVQEVDNRARSENLEAAAESIRRAVADQHELPLHTIAFVRSGSIPRTSSGKVRRQSCKQEFLERNLELLHASVLRAELETQVAPEPVTDAEDAVETLVRETAARVLGRDPAGISLDRSAIENGLDSLASFDVLSRIENSLHIRLPPSSIMTLPTLRELARAARSLADQEQHNDAQRVTTAPPVASSSADRTEALSLQQQGVLFAERLSGVDGIYNLAQAVRLRGPIDVEALERSFQALIERHESLRMSFVEEEGIPLLRKAASVPFAILEIEFPQAAGAEGQKQLSKELHELAARPFDLSQAPLMRAVLYRISEHDHVLLIVFHHLIVDGTSAVIITRELHDIYDAVRRNGAVPSSPLPVQYSVFTREQQRRLVEPDFQSHVAYWVEKLRDVPALNLPGDRPRPSRATFRGDSCSFVVDDAVASQLRSLAQRENATLFMVLLSAYQTLLLRYTGQDDFAVGSPVAGRLSSRFAATVGMFTNTLVLRSDVQGDPRFSELLARVRTTTLSAYEHQEAPAEAVLRALELPVDASRNPLFQVGLALQSMGDTSVRLPGLVGEQIPLRSQTSRTDLWISFTEREGRLHAEVEYATDLFDADTIARLTANLQVLLASIAADPERRLSELEILAASERKRLLEEWNDTQREYPLQWCMHELVEQTVQRSPDAVAVIFDQQRMTYAELNRRANHLAEKLVVAGVGPGSFVGICMHRSLELLVGMLAVLKAGGAFVPLDPEFPRERLAFMIEDAAMDIVLTQAALAPILPDSVAQRTVRRWVVEIDSALDHLVAETNPRRPVTPTDPAYVIFTSGSTGRPKGVPISHLAMCNHQHWEVEAMALDASLRTLQKTTISFDAAIFELFGPLQVGGTVVMARPGGHRDFSYLIDVIREHGITHLVLTPSAGRALVQDSQLRDCVSLRHVLFGGEQLDRELVRKFMSALPGVIVGNFYGPSETTEDATHYEMRVPPKGHGPVPIGRPISNMRCYVLDAARRLVPIGVTGELFIGGMGVARGYLNRPELSAEKFVPDPFRPGERLYRTGDLARYLPDGTLEFQGRADLQVKIRGFRIELEEVEAALLDIKDVRDCAVVAHPDRRGELQLIAYVVTDIDLTKLRARLLERVPSYMVPGHFVFSSELPRLPNGKIDRKSLPASTESAQRFELMLPRDQIEQHLYEIWRSVLGTDAIGIHDSFFDLGGHSLSATQTVSRIRAMLQVELPLRTLFESPTIAGIADEIRRRNAGERPGGDPHIVAHSREHPLPLSYSQRRMWLIQQLEPEGTAYNMPFATRLRGELKRPAMTRTFEWLAQRHEGLRTQFLVSEGEPLQLIVPHVEVPIVEYDLQHLPASERESKARELLRARSMIPFDLSAAPLWHVTIVRLAPDDHVVLVVMHHVIADQWSMGVLARDMRIAYEAAVQGRAPEWEPLPVQYADFAAWQRRVLDDENMKPLLAFWRERLKNVAPLSLPTDHARPLRQNFHGAHVSAAIAPELLQALRQLAAKQNSTLFMVLLAAFKLQLARYTGQTDIALGTPIANRTLASTEHLVGTLVNTLVLRTDLDGDPTFESLLRRVREAALEAYAHQDLPYERLVEELHSLRRDRQAPLVQVLFNVPNAPWAIPKLRDLTLEPFEFDRGSAQFDVSMTVDTEHFGRVHLEYATDLFEPETMDRFLRQYLWLLEQIAAQPLASISRFELLTPSDRKLVVHDWNETARPFPAQQRTDQLIAACAREAARSIAIRSEGRQLTYAQLESQINKLANYLGARGVSRGSIVGVCLDRSPELVVSLLAVMRAGATYVPLDPGFPRDRLHMMLSDADVQCVISRSDLGEVVPGGFERIDLDSRAAELAKQSEQSPQSDTSEDDLAYVLYTSGSTGRPKGVEVSHRALTNFLCSMQREPGCSSSDRLLSVTTPSFDISGLEFFLPLTVGAELVLASSSEVADGRALMKRIAQVQPTIMQATPATWRMLIAAGWKGDPRLKILCGGESLPRDLADQLLQRCQSLWNMYGPTETTIWSTVSRVEPGTATIDVGRPIANTRVYILDRAMQPLPPGVPGEIYIGGDGVARGYRGRPDLTAEKFLDDPFVAGARVYRTGDLGRYTPDGRIVHLGRLDHQVKIRGFRIELGEVQSALAECPGVAQAVVAASDDGSGFKRLVGYFIPADDTPPSAASLREYMKRTLPDYMVPTHFVPMHAFPLTANNKIDVAALPPPGGSSDEATSVKEPRDATAVQLLALWRTILGDQTVGPDDNFFDRGGHSLKAIELLAAIEKVFNRKLPVATLFEAPTVTRMAERLDSEVSPESGLWRALVAITFGGSRLPIFAVPGVQGNVLVFTRLAALLGPEQPFYALQARGLDGREKPFTRISKMASHYVAEIRRVRPEGPYVLLGACTGGVVAYEMAQQLRAQGEEVRLVMLDSWHPFSYKPQTSGPLLSPVAYLFAKLWSYVTRLRELPLREWGKFALEKIKRSEFLLREGFSQTLAASDYFTQSVERATLHAVATYRPKPFSGLLLNIVAANRSVGSTCDTRRDWERLAQAGSELLLLEAEDSGRMLVPPHVEKLAEVLTRYAEEASRG